MRLQKYLAACGLGSRRACEALIAQGRVHVNGRVVTQPGTVVAPERDRVAVDGRPLEAEPTVHLVVNKPPGLLCTSRDPQGRPTVLTAFKGSTSVRGEPWPAARLYTVGRLDADSEGLLLLTNDGDLAHRLTHPRHHVARVYRVQTRGPIPPGAFQRMEAGLVDDGERLTAESVRSIGERGGTVTCRVVLREGRKRQIRRLFKAVGLGVVRLQRIELGPLALGSLRRGAWRFLSAEEVARLTRDQPIGAA